MRCEQARHSPKASPIISLTRPWDHPGSGARVHLTCPAPRDHDAVMVTEWRGVSSCPSKPGIYPSFLGRRTGSAQPKLRSGSPVLWMGWPPLVPWFVQKSKLNLGHNFVGRITSSSPRINAGAKKGPEFEGRQNQKRPSVCVEFSEPLPVRQGFELTGCVDQFSFQRSGISDLGRVD
jgi:hypothetical protein